MNSRQSHTPLGKRKKGSLRFAEGKRRSTVGQTSRQAKQFASGIMGKYGFDRNNYLGMFALIFKGKGVLTDKELASIKNPSDRAWVLQLQLQLQNLKHPESAPLITKQHMIGQLQQLITQSGYRLPKEVNINESSTQEEHASSEQVAAIVDQPFKKRGRKSKKDRKLATQPLPVQETVHAVNKDEVKSKQEKINAINKRNSPIMGRSMRQLVASIGMLTHAAESKKIPADSKGNDVQQANHTTNIQQKTLHLLYKQALREGQEHRSSRPSEDNGGASVKATHTSVAQHVDAVRSTSEWLQQFQAGKLIAGQQTDSTVGALSSVKSVLQTQPSFMNVAKLILQDVTQTQMNQGGASQPNLLDTANKEVRRLTLIAETDHDRKSLKLGEGPFSSEATPSSVRFIRSLLLKHAEAQGAQAGQQPAEEAPNSEKKQTNRGNASIAKGVLAASQQLMAINAASLTSRLPRSMQTTARSNAVDRSPQAWQTDSRVTPVWRKSGEQVVKADQAEITQQQRVFNNLEEQRSEAANVIRHMQQQREELQLQASEIQRDQSADQQQPLLQVNEQQGLSDVQRQTVSSQVSEQRQEERKQEQLEKEDIQAREERLVRQNIQEGQATGLEQDHEQAAQVLNLKHAQEDISEQASEENVEQIVNPTRGRSRTPITSNDEGRESAKSINSSSMERRLNQPNFNSHVEGLFQPETVRRIDQQAVVSKRATAVTPLPSKIFRKLAAQDKGKTRSTVEKIQSNENWLQQLVIQQRQPSSADSLVRSINNSVSNNSFQATSHGWLETNDRNVFAKPDLSAEVRAKSASKARDDKWNGTERTVSSLHKTIGMTRKAGREAPFKNTDAVHRSTETTREQEDHSRPQRVRQTDQLENHVPVNESKLPTGQLAFDIAAKITKASLKTLGTMMPRSAKNIGSEMQEGGRVLRSPKGPLDDGNKHLVGQHNSVSPEVSAGPLTFGGARQALAAEIAAKVAQSTMSFERSSKSMTEGPLVLQRKLQKESNLMDTGTAAVSNRQNQAPTTQVIESGSTSRLGSRVESASAGTSERNKTGASAGTRESANGSASASSRASSSSSAPSNSGLTSQATDIVAGKRGSRSPIDMIRRAGSLSRLDRVREQQATIQRKMDVGQFVSRQVNLRISSQTQDSVSDASAPNMSRRDTWARGQLILRAGQVENGTFPRRSGAADPIEQPQVASETAQERQAQPSSEMETDQQVIRAEGPEHAQTQGSSTQASEITMSVVKEEENRGSGVMPTGKSLGQSIRDEQPEEGFPSRQTVRGTLVQSPSRVENDKRSRLTIGENNDQILRRLSRAEHGIVVGRLPGSENGIQARRAKSEDIARILGAKIGAVSAQLVQRSAGLHDGVQPGRTDRSEQVRPFGTTGTQERANLVQRSVSSESGSAPKQGLVEETARQSGLLSETTRGTNVQRGFERSEKGMSKSGSEGIVNSLPVRRQTPINSNRNFIQRATEAGQVNLIQRASESRLRQLIDRVSASDARQVTSESDEPQAVARRRVVNWTGAQAEHLRRQARVDDRERESEREALGSENRTEAERFQVDSAEQTIRAMVSAQVEERAQGLEPAAASRAAEVVQGARSARAPRARQNASMTPRVMPLLASPAGALRAAPAGVAAASPAAAERQLPARGTGSLTLAAASGRAAAPTAGVQGTASMTSSQGWAAALTKPLPTQVQRQARAGGAMHSSADHRNGAPPKGATLQSRTQPPSTGANQQAAPPIGATLQSRTQPPSIGANQQVAPTIGASMQSRTQPPGIGASHQAAPSIGATLQSRTQPPSIGANQQAAPPKGATLQSRTQPPSIGASQQAAPPIGTTLQSRTQPPSIGAMHQGVPTIGAQHSLIQTARQEHLAAPVAMLEHKQAPASQLSEAPLDMDWLRTKSSADQELTPAAPVEQAPPELSEEQIQELIKQLPQLDIAKIADKVYREIEKKMKFERQRRGV
ncbi:hypothetical protein A8709_06805 [Paenibacillus pectinilyticus]|uniref:Uncharacterized protein n=1 Tax=Paenibacillus pectinilyticus TaxID=512399 RepID=A0A1C0ZTG9_9BACL|nr:hypothetical protein [Paenibacillus pectinilyticus]OCT11378.1 hypothetical protein A8709_06805 [Paenibacillus pectinilyticus]